jgi:nitronate monooxygenase
MYLRHIAVCQLDLGPARNSSGGVVLFENLVMATSLHTSLCDVLGIEYPILSVGFSTAAGPELVAAVSNAGGFGVLGGTGLSPEQVAGQIELTRELTGRSFGVNFIIDSDTAEDRAFLRDEVAAAASQGVKAVVLFWGAPAPYLVQAHRNGV